MADIILCDITKSFGGRKIIDRLSITFSEGKTCCISGPSGCGKTTLLRMITGLETPDSGYITGVPKKTAFVFQEDRLCEDFSAVSNIRLVTGRSMSDKLIIEHLTSVGLGGDAGRAVREFSGGMKRRVAIVRAICYDAPLIIMDEPFKGLDSELKITVMDYVRRYAAGKTLICVTHSAEEAEYMGGESIVLRKSGG